jgi:hypothetical protein
VINLTNGVCRRWPKLMCGFPLGESFEVVSAMWPDPFGGMMIESISVADHVAKYAATRIGRIFDTTLFRMTFIDLGAIGVL